MHVPGKNLVVAYLLSRKPVGKATKEDEVYAEEVTYAAINTVDMLLATTTMLQRVREAQASDNVGKDLRKCIEKGWPTMRAETPENLFPYHRQQASLHIARDLILYKNRLWIPSSLRQEILDKLHASHFGVTKTCALARTSVWWPNMDADIAKCIADCSSCAETRVQRSEPLIPTLLPEGPWCKLGLDLLKEEEKWYVVVIDYYSKYLEIGDRLLAQA